AGLPAGPFGGVDPQPGGEVGDRCAGLDQPDDRIVTAAPPGATVGGQVLPQVVDRLCGVRLVRPDHPDGPSLDPAHHVLPRLHLTTLVGDPSLDVRNDSGDRVER